ncbi:MAG: cytochrome c oxidase subunit I [Actinomycetota bacterium]|nr:cytochrome c oxidase subunit I [Actinomycetota bacterium]
MATLEHSVPRTAGGLLEWFTSVDHKKIGILYLSSALVFFVLSGILALVMRSELAQPGLQLVDRQTYAQLFTMHGTGMMFFFGTPMVIGLANYFVPLHIGAPDVAFPRLNAFAFWLTLAGAVMAFAGFLTATGAAAFGWTAYAPLSGDAYSPGTGADLWIIGVALSGVAGVLAAVNLLATIFGMRAPGMSMLRMSIFNWNIVVTSILIAFSFPALTVALALLWADRNLGSSFFEPAGGGDPVLYQHLFWFFGHPEVYILILPFFGIVTEIIPVFSRKPVFGYKGFVFATLLIGAYSFSVWAHHMFTTGAVDAPFFSATSMLIAVPTGIKFFNWIGTMWGGKIHFQTPMLFCAGFLFMFLMGGITGVFLASPPLDYFVHDTYYVVAHLHYVLFGGSVFAMFAGLYYWIPKMSGRMLSEGLGKLHFVLLLVGMNAAFFPMHQLGIDGMQRRIPDYPASFGYTQENLVSTAGAFLIALAVLVFFINLFVSLRRGPLAGDDPWGGYTLEWATTSPPPHHNFHRLPPIRSARPVFDERRENAQAGPEGGSP